MAETELKEGQKAPEFTLPNQDGENISLRDYEGKYVAIYFYPKDNTPGCTTQGCIFRDYNQEIQEAGGVVLGISKDSIKSHQNFKEKHKLDFDLLSDEDKQVAKKYGAWGEKKMFGKKYTGMHRMTFLVDPKGKIVEIWPKANPKTNAKEVLEAMG